MTITPNRLLGGASSLMLGLALGAATAGGLETPSASAQHVRTQRASLQGAAAGREAVQDSTRRTAKDIERVYQDNTDALYECYKRAKAATPALSGTMTVRLLIRPDGKVGDAKAVGSTFKNEGLERCIIDRVKRFQFPPVTVQEMQQVDIPVSFED